MNEETKISELTVGQLCRLIAIQGLIQHDALNYPNSHDRLEASAVLVQRLVFGETLKSIRSPERAPEPEPAPAKVKAK